MVHKARKSAAMQSTPFCDSSHSTAADSGMSPNMYTAQLLSHTTHLGVTTVALVFWVRMLTRHVVLADVELVASLAEAKLAEE